MRHLAAAIVALLPALGCPECSTTDGGGPAQATPGNQVAFDLDGPLDTELTFFSFPLPSDLRLKPSGEPNLAGMPSNQHNGVFDGLRAEAEQRRGWGTIAAAWFQFPEPLAPRDLHDVIPAAADAPVILVDIGADSPERGRMWPTIAANLAPDPYAMPYLLGVAARPGVVLRPGTRYAFVVLRSLKDAKGGLLGVPLALAQLKAGQTPSGSRAAAAGALYAPLWGVLKEQGVNLDDVAAATVFTTGDAVADLHDLTERLKERWPVTIRGLHLDPDDGATQPRFCELHGSVTYPQFQQGTPPFNTDGLFAMGDDGLPVRQRDEDAKVVITVPKGPMPDGGYPLVVYFHGSGGLAASAVDYGPDDADGGMVAGLGPAYTVGAFGLATAATALPVNPERLPGAEDTAYLNLSNPKALRDTFRQGIIEQRLFIEAVRTLEVPPDVLEGCTGPSLPAGQAAYRFAEERLVGMGQSMGGMYTNLISAVEPRITAGVPTGAGGLWAYFIMETSLVENAASGLALLLGMLTPINYLHPSMGVLELAWEAVDPIVAVPRLSRRPLPGHPVRPVYEPAGKGDSYFPTVVYDAMALAYGNQQAGDVVWSTMQDALGVDGRDGLASYPVRNNLTAEDGTPYTGVVVQFESDGPYDPHSIYRNRAEVRHQVGCFVDAFSRTGAGVVVAPAQPGSPCQ